jgi:hypothetical protein
VDSLVEAGIMKTRSEAAAWLLHHGIVGNRSLFERVEGILTQMRHLREEAQRLAQEHAAGQPGEEPGEPPPHQGHEEGTG